MSGWWAERLPTFSRVGACSVLLRYARRGCGYILPSLHSRPWACDRWSRWWWCCLASGTTTRPRCGPPTFVNTVGEGKGDTETESGLLAASQRTGPPVCIYTHQHQVHNWKSHLGFHLPSTSCCLRGRGGEKKETFNFCDSLLEERPAAHRFCSRAKYPVPQPAVRIAFTYLFERQTIHCCWERGWQPSSIKHIHSSSLGMPD